MKKIAIVLSLFCLVLCAVLFGCNKQNTDSTDPCAAGHTFEGWTTEIKPTCGVAGKKVASCTVCGAAGEEVIPPTENHRLSGDTVLLGAGITTEGKYTATCSVCGQNMDDSIPALSQTLTATVSDQTAALDLTGYVILYDDSNTSTLFLSTIHQLQARLNAATGLSIPLMPLSQRPTDQGLAEILIGDTGRSDSYNVRELILGSGFTVKPVDNKLVITGSNELQTICAMQYLIYQLLPTHTGGATVAMPTIEAKNRDTLLLMNGDGSEFEVIYSKELKDTKAHNYVGDSTGTSTSDSRDYGCVAAHSVATMIAGRAEIGSLSVKSNAAVSVSAVLVGQMDEVDMKGVLASLDGDEYAIVVNNGHVLLAAWNDYALQACVAEFTRIVDLSKDPEEKQWHLPALFFAKGSANKNWVTDFPRPTGDNISLSTTRSANNDALQFVYEGTGVTPEAYAAYCQQLLDAGYTVYTKNSIEQSTFTTLLHKEKGIMLYVAYNAYAHKDEDRYKDPATHILTQSITNKTYGDFVSQHPLRDYQCCIRVISAPLSSAYLIPEELLAPQNYIKVTDGSLSTVFLNGNAVGHSYVVSLEDGSFVVVDGGNNYNDAPLRLYNTLVGLYTKIYGTAPTTQSPIRIAAWYVTHSHGDHYGAFRAFLGTYGKNGTNTVVMDYLIGNFPEMSAFYPVGSGTTQMGDMSYIAGMQAMVQGGFRFIKLHTGQKMYLANLEIETLMTFNDHAPFIIDNSNDTNTVCRFSISHKTVAGALTWLLPGDSCIYQSRYLCAMYGDYLRSDIMQMAHHGNIGCEIALYETVDPTLLFFSHHLSQYFTYTRAANKNRPWPYNVDYYVAHKLASVKYIITGGYTNFNAVTVNIKANGTLDFDNVYNPTTGSKIACSSNSETSMPATPFLKNP